MEEYFGYFGTFSIDLAKPAVIRHTQQSGKVFQIEGVRFESRRGYGVGKVPIIWAALRLEIC